MTIDAEGAGMGELDDWPRTPYVYRALIDGAGTPMAASDTLDEALTVVLRQLRWCDSVRLMTRDHQGVTAAATLFAISPGNALVIGVSELADQVRELLHTPAGIAGWRHVSLPPTRTSVDQLRPWLRPQSYNLLTRNQFATIEQVATMPARCWTDLRGAGPKYVAQIDQALAAYRADHPTEGEEPTQHTGPAEAAATPVADDLAQRQAYLTDQLSPSARLRYVRFAEQLAATTMPQPVLAAICASLNAEPLPPTDPTILLVLQTTGDAALLQTYCTTHDPAAGQPGTGPDGGPPPPVWTVELAEEILRRALPTGSTFLRALIDQGGSATAEQLRDRLGTPSLHPMLQTLRTAAAHVLSRHGFHRGHRTIVQSRTHPDDPRGAVHDYVLPAPLLPVFDAALRRLDR